MNSDNMTLLNKAALSNVVDRMKWLETKGFDINAKDSNDQTAMHHAARGNAVDAMKWLKKQGLDINAQDSHHKTPMHYAIQENATDAMKWLKANGDKTKQEQTKQFKKTTKQPTQPKKSTNKLAFILPKNKTFWEKNASKNDDSKNTDELPCQEFIEVIPEYDKYIAFFKFCNNSFNQPRSKKSKYPSDTIDDLLMKTIRNWGWCVDNKVNILKINANNECSEIKELVQKLKETACIDRIPARYREPTEKYWKNNKNTRDRFAKEQDNKCWHCKEPLESLPNKELVKKYKYRSWYRQATSNIHLHHCHKTGYAFGTVHSLCNQVLARCENE